MSEKTQNIKIVTKKIRSWFDIGLQILELTRKGSEYIFVILKLIAGIALFLILLTVVYHATKDHGKISVKPFSVPEEMQKSHKAAGSIIANIIKQELSVLRVKTDATIRGSSGVFERADDIISNDTSFFKGENIKLPETGISINDVVEFISGLFGRKNINGSVYKDSDTLYLQVEVDGKIFISKRKLAKSAQANSTALHIPLMQKMAEEVSGKILKLTSEKYRLYYSCIDESASTGLQFEEIKYKQLYHYCGRLHKKKSKAEFNKLREEVELLKADLSGASNIEQYVVTLLSSKIRASDRVEKVEVAQNISIKNQQKQIKMAIRFPKPNVSASVEAPTLPALSGVIGEGSHPSSVPPAESALMDDPKNIEARALSRRLSKSKVVSLIKECQSVEEFDRSKSNAEEQAAQLAYNKRDFFSAESAYFRSIRANCENPYAWANLGILLSDMDNKANFNALDGVVALQRAIEIKDNAGWIWHSLCVAEAYTQKDKFEQAVNNASCQKARVIEPGKQLIYDKLFNIALAEKYTQKKQYERAFYRYKIAVDIDPKRTCRLGSIVEKMDVIQSQSKIKGSQALICNALKSSYPEDEPDESCEASLTQYEKEKC